MMLANQIAGRHGSYTTQFWKMPATSRWTPARPHQSRAQMRTAYSRKALDRRLVLPLDSHNWIRALEVLNAGYARLGRTPEHFQAVLRDMVTHHSPYAELETRPSATLSSLISSSPRDVDGEVAARRVPQREVAAEGHGQPNRGGRSVDILPALDALRDRAYAGEIPVNRSLWVTFLWSYCALDQPMGALDTFHLATRRFHFSSATTHHMASLLLPVLCRHGHFQEAKLLYEEHLKGSICEGETEGTSSKSIHRSRLEDADARRWLAEAAARQGDWVHAQQLCCDPVPHFAATGACKDSVFGSTNGGTCGVGAKSAKPLTVSSLFDDALIPNATMNRQSRTWATKAMELSATKKTATRGSSPDSATSSVPPRPLPDLAALSSEAVHRLFLSICRGKAGAATSSMQVQDAVSCWERLYGEVPGLELSESGGSKTSDCHACPSPGDLHELLNLLASHHRWRDVLSVFCACFLPAPASAYLQASSTDEHLLSTALQVGPAMGPSSLSKSGEREMVVDGSQATRLPLDAITLNLLFACLPTADKPLQVVRTVQVPSPQVETDTHSPKVEGVLLELAASAIPVTVVWLFNDLLLHRDDMVLSDYVMAAVGPALLQVGQADRLFDLLARTPIMKAAVHHRAPKFVSLEHRSLKNDLVRLGYTAYALCNSLAKRHAMVRKLPHLFPPEVVRYLATNEDGDVLQCSAVLEGPVVCATGGGRVEVSASPFEHQGSESSHWPRPNKGDASPRRSAPSVGTIGLEQRRDRSLLDIRWDADANPYTQALMRLETRRRLGQRSSAVLTSLADDAMRRDLVRLQDTRHFAFRGSHTDAERDPRPIPKGLHDHASGWDFFGRGGEMAFSNHKRTPHPFSMRPKMMRDRRNPYRGWNPRHNSSLAHKENVVKWNGKSAV